MSYVPTTSPDIENGYSGVVSPGLITTPVATVVGVPPVTVTCKSIGALGAFPLFVQLTFPLTVHSSVHAFVSTVNVADITFAAGAQYWGVPP